VCLRWGTAAVTKDRAVSCLVVLSFGMLFGVVTCTTVETKPSTTEPAAVEVAPGVFIPGGVGYVVLLKRDGSDVLNWMNVPRHQPSAANLDELKLSLFNAACYATPQGSWPWRSLCKNSMLECTGEMACAGPPLNSSYDDEKRTSCLAELNRISRERVLLLDHWTPIQTHDSQCILACSCEGGALTLDKQAPAGYRTRGSGCVNAFTCSFVCPGGPGQTDLTAPSR
jgi:hypothetical protein